MTSLHRQACEYQEQRIRAAANAMMDVEFGTVPASVWRERARRALEAADAFPESKLPTDESPVRRMVLVRWLDSCILHDQVDADDLPQPSVLETVGWLSFDGPQHIVISRDHSPAPTSYSWRSSLAIPRYAIRDIYEMETRTDGLA